ncbi:peptidase S16 [Alteromonadaceae bacterium M269]|nr:peptidase S16 [Alteromonadaceae bacterium M269]
MNTTLPLFPLSSHILPGGRMALRIFEPRYVRMVKKACAENSGFGICMLNPYGDKEKNEHIYPLGSYVEVVDFELLDDGLLGITVEASRVFEIKSVETEPDELRVGQVQWLNDWEDITISTDDEDMKAMSEQLQEIYERYPEFRKIYAELKLDDPLWVMFRWLELLPIKATQKQTFLRNKNVVDMFNFLTQVRTVGLTG